MKETEDPACECCSAFREIAGPAVLAVLVVLSSGCVYNLYAQRSMEIEIRRLPRDPRTHVIQGTEAAVLRGDGQDAALLVHGFVGSRIDFNDLGPVLQGKGLTVRLMRLPGHGTYPFEHAVTTNEELLDAVRTEYDRMKKNHPRVALIGFSMGGALSTIVASERTVDRLVLIAPYYGITYRWYYVLPAEVWRGAFSWMVPYVVKNDRFTCVNRPEAKKKLFSYRVISTRGGGELVRLGKRARDPGLLKRIRCPVLVLHSKGDRAASPGRTEEAFRHIGSKDKEIVWYERSNHHLLWDHDREDVKERIVRFLRPLFGGKPAHSDSHGTSSSGQ